MRGYERLNEIRSTHGGLASESSFGINPDLMNDGRRARRYRVGWGTRGRFRERMEKTSEISDSSQLLAISPSRDLSRVCEQVKKGDRSLAHVFLQGENA